MQFKCFILDKFQEESVEAIEKNNSVVVSAPTGSGKTLIAEYIIYKNRNNNKQIIYTAPIKALSNQKYKDFSAEYGESKVGLMTGDIVINPSAKILIMTTEIYRNMVISNDQQIQNIAYVIFDEIHFINDIERGYVWEESIIYSKETVRFLCLSATIPNAEEFSRWIAAIKHHQVDTVVATERNVPLQQSFYDVELGLTTLEKIRDDKSVPRYHQFRGKKRSKKIPRPNHVQLIQEIRDQLPCFYFHFSRHACQMKAKELARTGMFKRDEKIAKIIQRSLRDAPPEINKLLSTKVLKETLPRGIGYHHAGLLPILKLIVEELFAKGLIKVLYVTETFAVGINMPAKTVIFDSLRKFDGRGFRNLNSKEYFQIAGRAGRRGIDKVGYVIVTIYRPTFRYHEIKEITNKDMDPIMSQFRISVNTVLNLINQHSDQEIEKILRLSFNSYQKYGNDYARVPSKILLATYNNIVKKLKKYDYLQEGKLTEKGLFSARVYADEISMGEIFATEIFEQLDEYQILLVLAALTYEKRVNHEFRQTYSDEQTNNLKHILYQNQYLSREKKFLNLKLVTAFIHPIYHDRDFFAVLKETNLLEGDLIRIYLQVLDRLGQVKKANLKSEQMFKIQNCEGIVKKALEGIYLV
ncbi:MAG: DEAD/DEAH box helicase [Nanoarchaeota archaeon]|nr:DEAD/DEAH box helicase [Nanoarchaeota archaeon]